METIKQQNTKIFLHSFERETTYRESLLGGFLQLCDRKEKNLVQLNPSSLITDEDGSSSS